MSFVATIPFALEQAIFGTFGPNSPYGAPALFGALLFSALYYVRRRKARGRRTSVRGLVRSIFPASLVFHPSSLVDMRMWALNSVVFASAYSMVGVGMLVWRDATSHGLANVFGPYAPPPWPEWTVLALASVLGLLAHEFAYWFGHYLFHKVPALWEFHKVHHSAEAMTIFTEMRQHPVEIVAFVNLIGFATGLVFGVMTYLFGDGARPFTLLNANIFLALFIISYGHLRHSRMWIPFTGLAGRILQSPAHHQLHHSDNPEHYGKNLGFALAIWDWAFGTLAIPAKNIEPVTLGIGVENSSYRSALGNFLVPFWRLSVWTPVKTVVLRLGARVGRGHAKVEEGGRPNRAPDHLAERF